MLRPVDNPPNPWSSRHVHLLEPAPDARLEVFEEDAASIVAKNDSPDIPFSFSVNPYRGCFHACAYCYARPTHQYLGFGAGTDFDRRIVVKRNAAALLDTALGRRNWRGDELAFSGVTDCYQPLEASYGLTRACLEVCLRHRNPIGIITKSALIERDVDVLAQLARTAGARVWFSVPFADPALARAIEPSAPAPARRLAAMRTLAAAGVPVGVAFAPIIPGLNDDQIPAVLAAARAAGATAAFQVALRLPAEVADVFFARVREAVPLRADRVENAIRAMRGGRTNDARFGQRMRGQGERFAVATRLFDLTCRRLGLATGAAAARPPQPPAPASRGRPARGQQGLLFAPASGELPRPARAAETQREPGEPQAQRHAEEHEDRQGAALPRGLRHDHAEQGEGRERERTEGRTRSDVHPAHGGGTTPARGRERDPRQQAGGGNTGADHRDLQHVRSVAARGPQPAGLSSAGLPSAGLPSAGRVLYARGK